MWLSLRYPSETLGSQGKHHRIYMWTLRKRGRAPQIPTGCGRVSPGKGGQLQPEEPCPGLRDPLHIRLGALRNTSGSQTNKEGRDAAFTTRVHRAAIISRTHRSHFSPRSASSTELFFLHLLGPSEVNQREGFCLQSKLKQKRNLSVESGHLRNQQPA